MLRGALGDLEKAFHFVVSGNRALLDLEETLEVCGFGVGLVFKLVSYFCGS